MEQESHDLLIPLVDKDHLCLPSSINAVAKYWNITIPESEANQRAKKYPTSGGSIVIEGIELAENHGLSCLILRSSIKEIKKLIDSGIPPIVIMPGIREISQHAQVLSGYDPLKKTVLFYIPTTDKEGSLQMGVVNEETFDKLWSEDGRIVIVIAPNEIIKEIKQDENENHVNRNLFISEREIIMKQNKKAMDLLYESIKRHENSLLYLSLASLLNESGNDECVKHYEKAIEMNQRCYLAFRGLGNYYLKKQNFAAAEQNYDRAISINSSRFTPIYKNRGYVRLQLGKNILAKKDFEKYIEQMPNASDKQSILQAIKEL